MQHRSGADGVQLRLIKAEILANLHGIDLHALQVIVRVVIFRLNSEGQSLDRAQVQISDRFRVFLLRFQSVEIRSIGSVNPVNDGQDQDGDLPP